ncbi:urea carboxylase-associated family protein [Phytoactinopolyspora alkaliphila]|uniref:Urea carboxylase-associated family protein n=1 Tax=Phytoactinopolyspora alkaliphila TaxID=1783498 RepID=A0A6N9YS88_9ACTN|nr:urea carboxylase-associated family protein [Phytoactinopolyspora alkaliphila]NED97901.1 urea carboxylase-associated family protein [Phytoactinopolyspora alkaliphila]
MTSNALINQIEVPARQARVVELAAGESARIVDVEGGQVGDVFAFNRHDPSEYLSAAHTRGHLSKLFPEPGEQFVTNQRRAILALVADDSPGRHDMLIPACDPARYRALGVKGWHASCAQNLQEALASVGVDIETVPQPVNVFMDIPVSDAGNLAWMPASTRPGDSVTFRSELDCLLVVSACPQDLVDINGGVPKPLGIEVLSAPTP